MKSERRHTLEENTLAKELTTWSDRLGPYMGAIWTAIAVLAVAYVAGSLWNTYRGNQERAAWDEYEQALLSSDVELKQLFQAANGGDHSGTEMQEWAYVAWADRQLAIAARSYLVNREDANKRVKEIAGIYEELAENADRTEVRNRARLGLARVNEMQGRLDVAKQQYGKVEGALATVADARIKALEKPKAEEITKWLTTAELPKRTPPSGPGTPGARPGFEAATPAADPATGLDSSQSLEEILGALGDDAPGGRYEGEKPAEPAPIEPSLKDDAPAEEPAAKEPAAEQPAAEEPAATAPAADESATTEEAPPETPADETPADEPAADEPPADEPPAAEPPASEQPADETPAAK
jgi:hypothetical protein